MALPRFRFDVFVLSPAHRSLRQGGTDVPLIPRYFDLLVLLVAERHRVVTRQEIFDRVWTDVVVSDGALSQAIRTIRRLLGDDSREPRFIRTVSRHGYQFVCGDVVQESDEGPIEAPPVAEIVTPTRAPSSIVSSSTVMPQGTVANAANFAPPAVAVDPFDELVAKLLGEEPFANSTDDERREAAEQLHALGTERALARLEGRPQQAGALAMLRDARWDVPAAGQVRLLGSPAPAAAIFHLVRLRLRSALRETSNRSTAAALGGIIAGVFAGVVGGVALWAVSGPNARADAVAALAIVGAIAGALGGGGVGAGMAAAEALARSARTIALVLCGALGGLLAGILGHAVTRAFVSGVFGRSFSDVGGWLEGLSLGAAAGLGYALTTALDAGGGLAAPRGWARVRVALVTGAACAVATVIITIAGGHFVASSLDAMASHFDGSAVGLAPLATALGEGALRPVTKMVSSAFEGLLFGIGLSAGLTHRPRR